MFYCVYKITNKINGKYYIGMHQTKDLQDDYMGSGKILKQAIKKYGVQNFYKEILHIFDNEEDMRNKEKELVVICENSYNLCDGGKGGFGYLNRTGLSSRKGAVLSEQTKQKISKSKIGTKLSEETKKKISENSGMKREEIKQKVSQSKLGKKQSKEHKENISKAIKQWHMNKKNIYVE